MTGCMVVMTTTDSREEAEAIAERLVNDRLAACVQIAGPITSIYRWEGELERAEEWLLLAKTTAGRRLEVEAAITQLHSYEVPEVIALAIEAGSEAYLAWLRRNVGA